MAISRRSLLQAGSGSLLLTPGLLAQKSQAAVLDRTEPHFFLEIFISGGWDVSYLFDARPLAMTEAGKIQNYVGIEPERWTDSEGRSTWVGPSALALKKHFDSFSILNGVHMASTFQGHDQNALYALTGNPFGGDTNLAQLGRSQSPLDFLQQGSVLGSNSIRNKGKAITLTPENALQLTASVQGGRQKRSLGTLIDGYVAARLEANGASRPASGHFADGAFKMREGLKGSDDIERSLSGIKLKLEDHTPIHRNMQVASEYFRAGLTRSAVIFLNPRIDAHDSGTAKNLPKALSEIVAQLAEVFDFLKSCAPVSNANQSLLDETTVLIGSEFARTMRQPGLPLSNTGTDHNPLNNSVILGGKGIRPGLIVGASDFRSADEVLSGAHLAMDPAQLSMMGMPFDHDVLGPPSSYKAENFPSFKVDNYLNFAAIANTLFTLFEVEPSLFWTNERNGPPVRAIRKILS